MCENWCFSSHWSCLWKSVADLVKPRNGCWYSCVMCVYQVEKVITVMSNPRQYKIPDWFLNRQKDIKDGKYTQALSNVLDSKIREDLERLKKIRAHRGLRHYWGYAMLLSLCYWLVSFTMSSQISLNGVQPRGVRAPCWSQRRGVRVPWWSPLGIILASWLSSQISLGGVQPCGVRAPCWSQRHGVRVPRWSQVRIILASWLSYQILLDGIHKSDFFDH